MNIAEYILILSIMWLDKLCAERLFVVGCCKVNILAFFRASTLDRLESLFSGVFCGENLSATLYLMNQWSYLIIVDVKFVRWM